MKHIRFFLALLIIVCLCTAAQADLVTLPEDCKEIPEETFRGDQSITSVVIPAGVTRIGKAAFYQCSALKNVYFGGTFKTWKAIRNEGANSPLEAADLYCTGQAAGWCSLDGNEYYFTEDGWRVTDWYRVDHKWYIFDLDGSKVLPDPDDYGWNTRYVDAEGYGVCNYEIGEDGAYLYGTGWFEHQFGHWVEDEEAGEVEWVSDHEKMTVLGTEYEMKSLMFWFGDDGKVHIDVGFASDEYLNDITVDWSQPGDDFLFQVGDDVWTFSQYKYHFTLEGGGTTLEMEHGNGWG